MYVCNLKGCGCIVFPMVCGWPGGWQEKVCPGCIADTKGCRKLTLVGGCRYATSRCDLDLTFDLAVVTLSLNILSGLYLGSIRCRKLGICSHLATVPKNCFPAIFGCHLKFLLKTQKCIYLRNGAR